jgi:DNA-directed RNA polymerase subunit RPC12/RpoP
MKNIRVYSKEIRYRCLKCGKVSTAEEISEMSYFSCPKCGFLILEKVRRDFSNEVLAR